VHVFRDLVSMLVLAGVVIWVPAIAAIGVTSRRFGRRRRPPLQVGR